MYILMMYRLYFFLLRYSNNYREVCQQRFQFSCWNQNDPNRSQMERLSRADLQGILKIVDDVIENRVEDPTSGSTHYYAPGKIPKPNWAKGKDPIAKIGNHDFFNNIA